MRTVPRALDQNGDPCFRSSVSKVDVSNSVTYLIVIKHSYLSAMWLHVAPKTGTKKKCV